MRALKRPAKRTIVTQVERATFLLNLLEKHAMHRLILIVAGMSILLVFGGLHLSHEQARAQDSSEVVADTFAHYARQSLEVGDKVLFASSSGIILLTEEQSKTLAKGHPRRSQATVTKIGTDYIVLRADETGSTYSEAFGTDMIETVIRFESIASFRNFVSAKAQ